LFTDRLGHYKYFVCVWGVSVFQLLVGYAQLRPIRNVATPFQAPRTTKCLFVCLFCPCRL